MGYPDHAVVALRSADAALVDAVRSVVAVADLPLLVHPPGAPAPDSALLLDSVVEVGTADPRWDDAGRRFAWVGTAPEASPEEGRCLLLPDAAEELLTVLRAVSTAKRARVIGVVGARGGAGASSLAAVLARACADAGLSVGLVDLDLDRGGLDVLVGMEHEPGLRWADLGRAAGGYAPADLSAGLPVWRGVRILSADLRSVGQPPLDEVLAALADAHDVVVLDLPRSAVRPDGAAARWCDTVVVIAPCDVQAAAGVQAVARALVGLPSGLVVRGPAPGGLRPEDLAATCGLRLLHAMPPERSLSSALERGVAPGDQRRGPLARSGRRLVGVLELAA